MGAYHLRPPNHRLLSIGIITHELGHVGFGFLDLYDVGNVGNGIGYWSVMGSGSWGGSPNGSVPTALDAFHLNGGGINAWGKNSIQLVAPKPVVSPGVNSLTGLTQYVKLETADPNQYFLIQPRGEVGYDLGLPSSWEISNPGKSGLLFLLVDNSIAGSNNIANNSHYRVAVVPAKWTSPTLPYDTVGLPGDLFSPVTKSFINDTSMPSCKIYAGMNFQYPTVTSGWNINSISSSAAGVGTNNGTVHASFTSGPSAPPTINVSNLTSFGSAEEPYTPPAAQTVTITNTGTGPVTLNQPTAANYEIGTLSTTMLTTNGSKATFTVRPKATLPVGVHDEVIKITGSDGVSESVRAVFTVRKQPDGRIVNPGEGGGGGCNAFGLLALALLGIIKRQCVIRNA